MRQSSESSESDRFVLCSEHIILECRCGERLVLLGFESDWRREGHTTFECECGEELTLADRIDEDVVSFNVLLRRFRTPGNYGASPDD
jgi:hypothetical protein